MPVYEFRCPDGHTREEVLPVDKRDDPMPCVECNDKDGRLVEMKRVPTVTSGRVLGGTPKFFPGRTGK